MKFYIFSNVQLIILFMMIKFDHLFDLFGMISLFSYFLAQNILNLETANCPRIFQYKSILEVTIKTPRVSSLLRYR